MRHIAEFISVVGLGINGFGKILSHFGGIDIKGCSKLDVANMVATERYMHEPGYSFILGSVLIKVNSMNERRSAIAHSNDGDSYFVIFHKYLIKKVGWLLQR